VKDRAIAGAAFPVDSIPLSPKLVAAKSTKACVSSIENNAAAADLAAVRQFIEGRWLEKQADVNAAMAREARELREQQTFIELLVERFGDGHPRVIEHRYRVSDYKLLKSYLTWRVR
jgi:hypothetical protein